MRERLLHRGSRPHVPGRHGLDPSTTRRWWPIRARADHRLLAEASALGARAERELARGRPHAARRSARRALAVLDRTRELAGAPAATVLATVADVEARLMELREAERLYRRALEIAEA